MSKIQFRLARSLIKPTPLIRYRSFSIVPCRLEAKKTKPELLPDVRLQELVAELERPLNLKSVSIDDTRDNLLSSVESYRPQKPILPDPDIEKLIAGLSRSFTVAQLNAYIKAHSVPGKGTKKQQLMERIIYQHWGVKSLEKVRQEELEKKRDRVSAVLPATLQELFFVIGENGKTMKDIENIYDVNITVDVEKSVYILEGPSKSVSSAKKELQSRLNVIKQDHVDLPQKVIDDKRLQIEIDEALGSLSKLAGSFITLKDNKIHIASVSNESMDDAKRLSNLLLTELDVTDKKPLDKADNVYVQRFSEYTALPLHDFKAMTLYNEYLNWDRLKCDKSEEGNFRLLSDEQGSVDFDKLGESLLKPYEDVSNISLEARFGYLLFQNMKEKAYYRVKSENLNDLFTKNRTTFLPVNPPYEITTPFDPLTIENGFHQRSIQLEYVNKGLLYNYESDNKDLERVQIEFNVDKRGDIELKNIIGEKSRRTIDVLGVHGQIDIRLIAKNYVNYNNKLGDLIEKCKLISYNDLEAPKSYDNLLLSDIKFMNKKNYTFENNLITIQHIEQQYKNTKRTELVVNPKTGSWPSFSSALTKVASRWNYVSTRDQL